MILYTLNSDLGICQHIRANEQGLKKDKSGAWRKNVTQVGRPALSVVANEHSHWNLNVNQTLKNLDVAVGNKQPLIWVGNGKPGRLIVKGYMRNIRGNINIDNIADLIAKCRCPVVRFFSCDLGAEWKFNGEGNGNSYGQRHFIPYLAKEIAARWPDATFTLCAPVNSIYFSTETNVISITDLNKADPWIKYNEGVETGRNNII